MILELDGASEARLWVMAYPLRCHKMPIRMEPHIEHNSASESPTASFHAHDARYLLRIKMDKRYLAGIGTVVKMTAGPPTIGSGTLSKLRLLD